MTLLEELARLFAQLGLGTYAESGIGGTLYHPVLPSTPDRCMAIARYGGTESPSNIPVDQVSIQVRCRGSATDSREAETDAQSVYDALHGLAGWALTGGTWLQLAICPQGGPVYMGRDADGRHEYVLNLRIDTDRPE